MEIPYTVQPRPDTGVTNSTVDIWLFLASDIMLFVVLFSAYVFFRLVSPEWPWSMARQLTTFETSNFLLALGVVIAVSLTLCPMISRLSLLFLYYSSRAPPCITMHLYARFLLTSRSYVGAWKRQNAQLFPSDG